MLLVGVPYCLSESLSSRLLRSLGEKDVGTNQQFYNATQPPCVYWIVLLKEGMINSAQGESEAFPAEVISVDPSRVSEELLGRQEVGGQRVRDRVGERALQAQETAQALACD